MEGGREVDGDDPVPLLDREILDLLDILNAGIVDEDVDVAEAACRRRHQVGDLVRLRHVSRVVDDRAGGQCPDFLRRGLDFVRRAEAVQDDIGAAPGESLGDGKADAARRTGDDRCFRHCCSLPSWRYGLLCCGATAPAYA
ncbi:hypothetical protein D9M72_493050 [compost metagenome]